MLIEEKYPNPMHSDSPLFIPEMRGPGESQDCPGIYALRRERSTTPRPSRESISRARYRVM